MSPSESSTVVAAAPPSAADAKNPTRPLWPNACAALLLIASVFLLALHYVHLKADFPHFSPWNDPARVTDEGWYAGASLRHLLSGGWRLPGDFNPSVALPVFPLIVSVLFHFTGVSVVALRGLNATFFAATLLAAWLLVRRYSHPLAAAGAVFLIACSPIYYAYSRLGTLEPLLSLEGLLALLAASSLTCNSSRLNYKLTSIAVGILLTALVFTKTTGICLYPAVFYLLASRCDFNPKACLRPTSLAAGVTGGLIIAYCTVVRRAGLASDFSNLFVINNSHIHGRIALSTTWAAAKAGSALGLSFYLVSIIAIFLFLVVGRKRQSPLFNASALGVLGYGAFIVYHGWLIPRYYYPLVPLLVIALVLALAEMATSKHLPSRVAATALTAALLLVSISQIRTLLLWSRHPSYSYPRAAEAVYRIIDRDPAHNRVVLSSISEQLALLTAEPGVFINPVYGTTELPDRILRYKPGWLITFNPVDPRVGLYSQQLVDKELLFDDDPFHSELFLYKLTLDQH